MADVKIEKTVGLPAKIVAEVASDSDDDLPITTMIKKREREEKAYREAAERERKAVKSNTKSESAIKSKSSSSETKKSENKNEGGGGGGGGFTFYENTDKGRLIHAFLIRWWYAYDWPTPEEIGQPPAGFESLDGFPGVFVSTREDSLGKILDLRNKEKKPCLSNFITMPSSEIKELCVTALRNQMAALAAHEGADVPLMIILQKELNEIQRIDPEKADKSGKPFVESYSRGKL